MNGKVIDFDAYRKEREARAGGEEAKAPPVFVIGGREYPLPPEPPATIVIDVVRLKEDLKDATAEVPVAALSKIGEALFGPGTFRELLAENGVGAAEMGEVILQALGAYELGINEGSARPNRRARRARRST